MNIVKLLLEIIIKRYVWSAAHSMVHHIWSKHWNDLIRFIQLYLKYYFILINTVALENTGSLFNRSEIYLILLKVQFFRTVIEIFAKNYTLVSPLFNSSFKNIYMALNIVFVK